MPARDGGDDRQAEPRAAALAGARAVRPSPAVEDARESFGRDAGPRSETSIHDSPGPVGMCGELDGVARVGVLHRVLEQRVERVPQRFRVGEQPPGEVDVEPPGSGRDLRPADEEIGEEGLEVDLLEGEARLLGLREQQQPLDDPLHPAELVERHLELRRLGPLAPQQLEMPARDRHGSPQLVRRVVEEAFLALEERRAHLGHALNLRKRRLPAAAVQHEPDEEREHERDHERLAPLRVVADRRDRERREDCAPDLGAVTP